MNTQMTAYADLSPCTYFSTEANLVAVGWLSDELEFETGASEPQFFEKLVALAESPWQPVMFMGFYECELCQYQPAVGTSNVFVPFNGCIYVAPELAVHYIAAHRYKPPQVFVDAVMNCPEMNSMEYKKAFLANGGRPLISEKT